MPNIIMNLLPSEWADQSNPVLCIIMACMITATNIQNNYIALFVNAVH